MLKTNTGFKSAACLVASFVLGASASAAIIYDNSEGFLGRINSETGGEVGDVIRFQPGTTDRLITDIQFEYFLAPNPDAPATFGNEFATFRVYANDADGNFPGTLLYQSNPFSIEPGTPVGYGTASISDFTPFLVPEIVTWTVTFSGIEAGERGSLLFYGHPEIGESVNFDIINQQIGAGTEQFYVRRGIDDSWEIVTTANALENFGVRFTAIPEPSTWALLVGGLAAFGLWRRRQS